MKSHFFTRWTVLCVFDDIFPHRMQIESNTRARAGSADGVGSRCIDSNCCPGVPSRSDSGHAARRCLRKPGGTHALFSGVAYDEHPQPESHL